MWPWEHLAVGYILYSGWRRARGRPRHSGPAVFVLAVATQLPDLVDKPLGWGTTVLPSGHSFAHSLLVAVPLVVAAFLVLRRRGHREVGVAFGVGYLSHLPGDMVYPLATKGELGWRFLVWPVLPADPTPPTSLVGRTGELFGEFVAFLGTPAGLAYLCLEALLLVTALLLWYGDGAPGVTELRLAAASLRSQ